MIRLARAAWRTEWELLQGGSHTLLGDQRSRPALRLPPLTALTGAPGRDSFMQAGIQELGSDILPCDEVVVPSRLRLPRLTWAPGALEAGA